MESGVKEPRVIGVVCTRLGSKRLQNKNLLKINGQSLADRAEMTLIGSVDEVILYTDIDEILEKQHADIVTVIDRRNFKDDGEFVHLQDSVRNAISQLDLDNNDIIVVLMANCPFINELDVMDGVKMLKSGKKIVRSYSMTGSENGLIIFRAADIQDNYDIYTGSLIVMGFEIHEEGDYIKAKKVLGHE